MEKWADGTRVHRPNCILRTVSANSYNAIAIIVAAVVAGKVVRCLQLPFVVGRPISKGRPTVREAFVACGFPDNCRPYARHYKVISAN